MRPHRGYTTGEQNGSSCGDPAASGKGSQCTGRCEPIRTRKRDTNESTPGKKQSLSYTKREVVVTRCRSFSSHSLIRPETLPSNSNSPTAHPNEIQRAMRPELGMMSVALVTVTQRIGRIWYLMRLRRGGTSIERHLQNDDEFRALREFGGWISEARDEKSQEQRALITFTATTPGTRRHRPRPQSKYKRLTEVSE